jgi:hypothetical protein
LFVCTLVCALGRLLQPFAETVSAWFGCHPDLLLVLVMIVCPVCMNGAFALCRVGAL